MADRLAVLRVLDELLWALRRAGFVIAPSQAIDVARAVRAVGLDDGARFADAVAAVVVQRAHERPRFDRVLAAFFAPAEGPRGFWDRLRHAGFGVDELAVLRELLEAMATVRGEHVPLGALLERGPELARLLQTAGSQRALDGLHSTLQTGFFAHRLAQAVGLSGARNELAQLEAPLADALGHERASALLAQVQAELRRTAEDVRAHVSQLAERRNEESRARGRGVEEALFAELDPSEVEEVRRAVRNLVARLRGRDRVRRRRAARGRIDPHRTMRRAVATGFVPFRPARKRRLRDRPKLLLLCDVSESVRASATFMLELVYAAHDLFEGTRSFVFVSEVGETTELFRDQPIATALARAYGGAVVSVADNSNYGRALRAFESRYGAAVDRKTTVVILGDGRSNYHDDGAEVLSRFRRKARALLWLCPDPRSRWSVGDSAMARYAPLCTRALEIRCAKDLELAARAILASRP